METRVDCVKLRDVEDIESLIKYSGHGKCLWLSVFWRNSIKSLNIIDKLRYWAECNNWHRLDREDDIFTEFPVSRTWEQEPGPF